jgi:hypothetical protein
MEAPMSELGPEARAILEAGKRGDDPGPEDRARMRRALMASIAAGGAGAAASIAGEGAARAAEKTIEAAGTAKLAGGVWKLLLGLAVVGAVGGGLMLRRSAPAAQEPAAPVPIEAQEEARAAGPVEMPQAAEPAPPVRAEPAPPANPAAAPAAKRAPAAVKAPPLAAEDTLEAETRRLREAHDALNRGNAARALELLDAQSADFAGGQLREERAAARALSLCKLGRTDQASAEAGRFLRDNPRSPLADRVRAACSPAR